VTNVIAHRGASRAERENTREAFTAAVRMGAAGIELDARRTADGAIVVNHDARLPDGREIIACQRVDLPEHVLTLGEALDACAGAFVNIEIKNDPAEPDFDESESVAEGVVALLASRAEPITNWIISSFRIESVDRSRTLAPDLPTAWLTYRPVTSDDIDDVVRGGHVAIHPAVPTVDADLIARCHERRLAVNTWTCNDPARARQLAAWGVDGICTDVPDEILAALRDHPSPLG
jgi:glycerophosphoryl diester phosphodiesterase